MITKYTSFAEFDNRRQKMEFIFFKHLILCMDLTNREFHVKYRYENPSSYFLNSLSHKKHKIVKEESIPLKADIGKLNDLDFSLYSVDGNSIMIFSGLAVYGGEKGLGIIEDRRFGPGRPLPSKEIMKAILDDIFDTNAVEDFLKSYGEYDLYSPCLRSRIANQNIADVALQLEEMNYRVFDDVYRCPGESDDDEQRIETLQVYYDHVQGYFFVIEDMKRLEEEMQEYSDELNDIIPPHRALADKLGLNLQLFDTDGNRVTTKCVP